MSGNEGCGGHMSTTEHAGGFRGRKGCCRRAIFMPKRPRRTKCTGQQEKEQEQANCQMPKKVGQPKKAESKIKIAGKMKKKKRKDRKGKITRRQYTLKPGSQKKTDGDNENLTNRRYIAIKTCNSKQCNIIAMNKMSEKK